MKDCAICALVSAAVAGMIAGGVAISELFTESGGDDDHDKQVLNEETPIDVSTTNPFLLILDSIFSGAYMSTT